MKMVLLTLYEEGTCVGELLGKYAFKNISISISLPRCDSVNWVD